MEFQLFIFQSSEDRHAPIFINRAFYPGINAAWVEGHMTHA